MKHALIRTTGAIIPGGYCFNDSITGKGYYDMHTRFDARVDEIINDRRANHRLFTDESRLDPLHVAKELSEQNCERLKNNPLFCSNSLPVVSSQNTQQPVIQSAPPTKGCRYCGSDKLTKVYCPTCIGQKLIAYRCSDCKKEFPV